MKKTVLAAFIIILSFIRIPDALCQLPSDSEKEEFRLGFRDIGIYMNAGKETPFSVFQFKRVSYRTMGLAIKSEVLRWKEAWRVDIEANISLELSKHEGEKRRGTTAGVGFSVYRTFGLWGPLHAYLGISAEVLFLHPNENQDGWGDSGILGGFGPGIGLRINLEKYTIDAGTRFIHKSDPLYNDDRGRDTWEAFLGIRVPLE